MDGPVFLGVCFKKPINLGYFLKLRGLKADPRPMRWLLFPENASQKQKYVVP